jgi:hypothetical protein
MHTPNCTLDVINELTETIVKHFIEKITDLKKADVSLDADRVSHDD